MATRWTNRLNPISWLTRRRPRTAPVAPGGRQEFATPSAYSATSQHDYSAADRPFQSNRQEWFAEEASQPDFHATSVIAHPISMNDWRPRTRRLEYDADHSTLRVTYRDGITYEYNDFDQESWDELALVRYSTGKWLDQNLLSVNSGNRIN
jgi:KTSC domain